MKNVWNAKNQYEKHETQEIFDCYIAEALLSEGRYTPTLESALKKYKAQNLDEVAQKQKSELKDLPQLEKLFYEIEMPLSKILWNMEQIGITLNTKKLSIIGKKIKSEIENVDKEIIKAIGYEINLNSASQVGDYLADKEGVPLRLTKTGKYATNESELIKFKEQFSIIQKILIHRELSKLHTTYVESLIKKVDAKSRLHTTYHQVAISTGRLASSNPNLQNIPGNSIFGKQIKSCFEAVKGYMLVSFDYSQQELRTLAHLSMEKKLIEAFQSGRDVHTTTASQIFHIPYENVTVEQRKIAKTINFGIVYGMSAFGMSENLHIPVEDAEKFIQNFYATFPQIKIYYDNYLKNGKINGSVKTLLGRRRYIFENPTNRYVDNGMKRVIMNYPIQGSAADLMKKTMVEIDSKILQHNANTHLLLQVHDELVLEINNKNPEYLKKSVKNITKIMTSSYQLAGAMDVKVKMGKNWGEMEEYEI